MSNAITQARKNVFNARRKRLLSTTAIVAAGMMVSSHAAQAQAIDPNADWDNINIVAGSANVTDTGLGSTQIDQHTMRAVGEAQELHIGTLGNVSINQSGGSNALFVARAIGDHDDPTQILGTLKANGRVMILDRNGVIFGENSNVDVAGIAASTGEVSNTDIMDGDNSMRFENFGDGKIELRGTVSVADSGLAAFVSPTVVNSGVINAKMGKVVMAAGEAVTLDMYGDGLVEVAVEGELGNALLESTGEINAEGGEVVMTASVAKGVVDNIINVEGVVDVSSVSQQGGKIILSGGNINVAKDAQVKANNGGEVIAIADGKMQLDGKISATGGFVETSGTEVGMGAEALVTASQWLIDPLSILISNVVNPDFTNISAAALAASLSAGTNTTIITGINSTVTGGPTDDNAGNIVVFDEINVNSATDVTLSLQAYNNILVAADIKATGPAGLNLELIGQAFGPLAGEQIVAVGSDIDTNGGYFLATADRFIMGDVFGAGSSIDTTGAIDNVAVVIADDYDIAGTINAGTSAVKFTRLTDGAMSLGDFVSGAHLTQAELEQIDAGTLIIGGEHVNQINVGNVNTTTATISGAVSLTTSVSLGDDDDVNFTGTNVFNALQVNSNDDIVFADNASVETLIGDATFFGDSNNATVGNFEMGQGSRLDTNGNNVVVSALNTNMGVNSTIASEGGNINIEARNDFAGDGDVTLQSGALIDADGGNIVINNKDIFSSVDKDSVRTHTSGTIDINQNEGGSIQNAIDAVDNAGSGLNTIHVGAGTYGENILVYEDNFLLEGINHGIDPNTGVRGPESLIDGGLGGPDGERFGFKVTSNNVTIDGFQFTGDGNGVLLDGGDVGTSKFDIKNNIITTINDADGDDEGVRGINVGDVIVRNNHLNTIGNHGMQFTKVNNVFILDNVIDGVIDEDGIHFDSPLSKGSVVIRDNTIVAPGDDGIDLDGVSGTAVVEISGNTIVNATDDGIDIGGVTSKATVVLADSASNAQTVTGNSDGVEIRNIQSPNGVSIFGGSYAGNEHGLLVDNTTTTSTRTGRLVLNNVTPLTFYGLLPTSKAFSALTNAEGPGLDIDMQTSTASFVNGEVGMHLSGAGIDILGDTIGATEYVNNSKFFIQLADGAEFQPGTPTLLDGSNATFYDATITGLVGPGGISGIDASAGGYSFAEINALANVESKVHHYLDGEDLGLFSLIPDGFVGDSSFGLQGIQRMINVASAGDTLLLGSGVYNDPSDTDEGFLPLEVYKSLTILGATHETSAVGAGRTAGSADEVVLDFAGATGAAGVTVSPAILIYADNVTLKGVDLSTDSSNIAGIRLLDLDAGGSLDNIDISNNFIHGGAVTPIIGHGITTTNDLLSQGYTNINIAGNDIFNATGDGAHIDGATGLVIASNLVHDVGQNGVVVDNSNGAIVTSNVIDNTGLDGIEATNSAGIVIISNQIGTSGGANNIGAEGIDVNGSDGALIVSNTVANTVSNGISVNPSSNVFIIGNSINNTGADGVLVTGGSNNLVVANQIGTLGGANNIGDDGVHISGSDNALVDSNAIQNTVGNGVHVNPSNDVTVSGNNISFVGKNGVLVESGSGVDILGNVISQTALNGIQIDNHDNADVYLNLIGQVGIDGIQLNGSNNAVVEANTVDDADDDGIDVNNSDNAVVIGNLIGTNNVDGSIADDGVTVGNGSDTATIKGNTIRADGRGVSVFGGSDHVVHENAIRTYSYIDAEDEGVYADNTVSIDITDNNIFTADNAGIRVNGGSDAKVTGNDIDSATQQGIDIQSVTTALVDNNEVDNTGSHGINAFNTTGLTISNNLVGTTGGASNINGDGIHVSGSPAAQILGNTVNNATLNGIYVNPSPATVIQGNIVDGVGLDGIIVIESDNSVIGGALAGQENTISNVGDDGIDIDNSSNVIVQRNTINTTGDNGVEILGGTNNKVLSNDIDNIGWDGVNVWDSTYAEISGNTIDNVTGASGIAVMGGSHNALVQNNVINGVDRLGIYAWNSNNLDILNNDINDTGREGGPNWFLSGIHLEGVNNTLVQGNLIRNTGGDGVHIGGDGNALAVETIGNEVRDNVIGYTTLAATDSAGEDNIHGDGIEVDTSHNAQITGNKIVDASGNGIYNKNSDGSMISGNTINSVGLNGILVNPSDNVTVSGNTISNALQNGIKIESGSWIDVLSNNISFAALNGIHVDGSNNVRIKDNTVSDVGIDGIHANNIGGNGLYDGSALIIKGNNVSYAGDDGIEVLDSGKTLIKNNNISYVGYNSYYYDGYYGAVLNNGDGIHVDNVFGFDGDYDIKIVGNNIHQTGDDGIDVGNSGLTLISGNNISDAGVGDSEESPYYAYGYGDEHGADGIFVHNSGRNLIEMAELEGFEGPGYYGGYGYHGYGVNIIDNNINATGDDGIEVINSGSTYVAGNNVTNTGVSEYYGGYGYYSGYYSDGGDLFGHGADGIHVRNVYGFGPIFLSGYEGDYYDVAIVGNNTNNTSDDGIEVVDSGRTLIRENKVRNTGLIGDQNVQDGDYYGEGYRSLNFSGGDYYGADGIHVRDSGENFIRLAALDSLEGPGYYGGYGYHGYEINIIDNDVNTTGDDGIEVVDSGSTLIDDNRIKNVGVTKVKEVYYGGYGYEGEYYGYGEASRRTGADEYGADAVHVRGVHNNGFYGPGFYGDYGYQPYAVVVSNNDIENVSDDGVEVLDSGRTRIEYNDIEDTGLKGYKYITQGYGEYEDVLKMKFSGGDYYGADGIHVRNVFADYFYYPSEVYEGEELALYPYEGFYGNSVEIVGNDIEDTGDDGIEVVRSGRTLIDSNNIYDVGVNALDEGYGYGEGYGYYGEGKKSHDGFGADGIHVREVLGQVYIYGDYAGIALPGLGVEIVDNHIDNTADDGIQVLWSGNTLIHNNTILNAGNVVEEYLDEVEYYGGYGYYGSYELLTRLQDNHGADGIHVHTGFFKNGLPGYEGEYEYAYEGYSDPYFLSTHVEITNNTIGSIDEETGETSEGPSDDGIETEGVTSLLIADNNVYDAGDDGIKVIGYAGFFANEVELPEEEVVLFGGYGYYGAPEFNVVIERNTVIDSGSPADEVSEEAFESESYEGYGRRTYGVDYDGQSHGDGIEITGYDRADVFDNVVTNSMENGLYVSGPFNARFETNVLEELDEDARRIKVAGNIFTNNRIGANFESGLIDMTGTPNQFIGGDHSEIGLLFKPFDFASLESDDYHYGDYGYYGDYGFQKVTPRDFGAWQGWPIHTYVPTEGYADLALLDVDGAGSTPYNPEVIPTNFGGTIGSQIFRGFQESGDFFVALDNFAFFDQESGLPIWQNALNSTFETPFGDVTPITTGGILSQNVFDFLEEKFFHFPDRGDIGIFFFGFVPVDIDQARIFDEFDPFAAGLSGLNVTITGLPPLNLGGAQALANIEPAAGGEGEGAADLASIEPAAGGEDTGCMGDVVNKASTGTPASINWGGTTEELLSDAAGCGSETF